MLAVPMKSENDEMIFTDNSFREYDNFADKETKDKLKDQKIMYKLLTKGYQNILGKIPENLAQERNFAMTVTPDNIRIGDPCGSVVAAYLVNLKTAFPKGYTSYTYSTKGASGCITVFRSAAVQGQPQSKNIKFWCLLWFPEEPNKSITVFVTMPEDQLNTAYKIINSIHYK